MLCDLYMDTFCDHLQLELSAFCILWFGKVLVECIKAGDVNECPWPRLDHGEVGSTPGDGTSGQQVTILGPLPYQQLPPCPLQRGWSVWLGRLVSTLKCHANLYTQGLIILSTLSTHLPGYSLLFFNPSKPIHLNMWYYFIMMLFLRGVNIFASELLLLSSMGKQQLFSEPRIKSHQFETISVQP